MAYKLVENVDGIMIETPSGFRSFTHIAKTWHNQIIKVILSDGSFLRGSLNHKIKMANRDFVKLCELELGQEFEGGVLLEDRILLNEGDYLYDLIDVDSGHQYLTGSIISHNCEFLSTDALLVSSMRLAELRSRIHDYEDNGFRFWSQPERSPMYLVGVDVATGSGQDYSVVEVFAFPSLQQVAQYRSNELKIPALYDKIKWILNRLSKPVNNRRPDVMWTFERNAIGEAISALYNTDELQPEHAELINDVPGKFGMVTTARSKVLACMQLKALIEKIRNGINLNSDMNIFELKNFIATGGSYAGKQGATDDTVMALLLIVRLIKYVADFDPDAHRIMYSHDEHDYEDDLEMTDEPIAFIA